MATITITNEFETDSEKVAFLLAERLHYEYIGDDLIAQIAKELHLSPSEAKMLEKEPRSSILRLVDRYTCSVIQRVVDREHGCLDDRAYHEKTLELVEKLYENGNMIILGWGGQCILKNKPGTLHVRLRKDAALKVEKVVKQKGITPKAAEQFIAARENESAEYIRQYFKEEINDARLYDLVIDMGKTTVDQAVDLICDNLKHKQLVVST